MFLTVAGVMLVISAQMVLLVPTQAMFILIGVSITGFTFLQLLGWRPRVAPQHRLRAEIGVGAFAGAMGGFSGTWGPPTILLLIALDTPKREHIRIQGVLYAMGSVVFVLAHIISGVLNRATLPFALAMLVPTMGGMWLGIQVQDRIDQRFFQKATLVVLFFAGLNLIRRGVIS
ncbi:sulfite exporter TauE/SafE family protein [Aquicoccus sp. G2-2]|uniref:sulfite exporter TauE/SafE family protein n=1 Tax=Aquicoccus sp. G2-2 TaxID=3092120 RepID=UPI002ADF099E|nr:sulfite exporter TauE/SafE family protein [Aquicoccus sp. G2-2]MEA1112342.1 sulfite exporter TauE/SafE family protein [Aquicoccus sp. G2-2]